MSGRIPLAAALALLLVTGVPPAAAQEAPSAPPDSFAARVAALPVGASVRFWSRTTGTDEVRGNVLAADTASLRVRSGKKDIAVPVPSLWRIDVQRGRRTSAGIVARKTALGALAGAALGYGSSVVSQAIFRDCRHCLFGPTPEEERQWRREDQQLRFVWAGAGVVAGTAYGAWTGRRRGVPSWESMRPAGTP